MIPKIIHYCWFGDKEIPKEQKQYIEEWHKILPDYKFMLWNDNSIDLDICSFVRGAYNCGKMAFVADYVRLYALYQYGGIYLDTDVKVLKSFDSYLSNSFFSSVEWHPITDYQNFIDKEGNRISSFDNFGISIHSAVIASEPNHIYISECLDYYHSHEFSLDIKQNKTIPVVLSLYAEKYGFKYLNKYQSLDSGIAIYSSDIFSEYRTSTKESVVIHFCEGSWVEQTFRHKLENFIKKNKILYKFYQIIKKFRF